MSRRIRRWIEWMIRKGKISEIVVNRLFPEIYNNGKLTEIPVCEKCSYANDCLTGLKDPVECLIELSVEPPKDRCIVCWKEADLKHEEYLSFEDIRSGKVTRSTKIEIPVCREHYTLLLWVLYSILMDGDEEVVRQHLIEEHNLSESELEKIPKQLEEIGEALALTIDYIRNLIEDAITEEGIKGAVEESAKDAGFNIEGFGRINFMNYSEVFETLLEIGEIHKRLYKRMTGIDAEDVEVVFKDKDLLMVGIFHLYKFSKKFEKDYGFGESENLKLENLKEELEGWRLLETMDVAELEKYVVFEPHIHVLIPY